MKLTMPELADLVTHAVRDVGSVLAPEEDWEPTLFMVTPEGIQLTAFADMVNSDETKDVMCAAINVLLRQTKASGAGLVLTAWTLPPSVEDPMSWVGRVSEHPERKEVLFLTLVTAAEQLLLQAEIKRSAGPPELSEWKKFPGATAQGRFLDAMRQAVM